MSKHPRRQSSFHPWFETLEDRCVPAVTVLENTPYVFAPADFGLSDPNQTGSLSVTAPPVFGTLTDAGASVGYGQGINIPDIWANLVAYTPATNMNGFSDNFTYQPPGNGGGSGDPMNMGAPPGGSSPQSITMNVIWVNQAPSFTATDPPATDENADVSIPNWASFTPGPWNESSQTATYIVTNVSNPSLFSAGPSVDSAGKLTYSLAPWASGTSTFDVKVQDNGGIANNGEDTSPVSTFNVLANNRVSFTVNTTNDTHDAEVGNGLAQDEAGNTSLRAAIEEGDAAPTGTLVNIKFNVSGTAYLQDGVLPTLVGNTFMIDGNTADGFITINANASSGIFYVNSDATATIDNFNLTDTANAPAVTDDGSLQSVLLKVPGNRRV